MISRSKLPITTPKNMITIAEHLGWKKLMATQYAQSLTKVINSKLQVRVIQTGRVSIPETSLKILIKSFGLIFGQFRRLHKTLIAN